MRVFAAPMAIVAVAALTYGFVTAFPNSGAATGTPEHVSTRVVELDGATEAQIHLTLDTGEVWVAGASMAAGRVVGVSELLRAEFTHATDQAPVVDYDLMDDGRTGGLTITAADSDALWSWSATKQRWDLYVNPVVPTELTVEVGTGTAELVVGGMLLTKLNVVTGSGDVTLDLTGDWRTSLVATVKVGAGDVTIRTPRDTGVKIVVDQGAGTVQAPDFTLVNGGYVNEDYGETASEIDIHIEQGAGFVELSEA